MNQWHSGTHKGAITHPRPIIISSSIRTNRIRLDKGAWKGARGRGRGLGRGRGRGEERGEARSRIGTDWAEIGVGRGAELWRLQSNTLCVYINTLQRLRYEIYLPIPELLLMTEPL